MTEDRDEDRTSGSLTTNLGLACAIAQCLPSAGSGNHQ
jgi:hypothetical protein